MSLLSRFLERSEFDSYEDFYKNFRIKPPENFNFAYDVVDVYAEEEPDRVALVWTDDLHDEDQEITFADLAKRCNRFVNLFRSFGIERGDPVLLILQSRHEFWPALLALHKLAAIAVPATHMLKKDDLVYRLENGQIKGVVTVNSNGLPDAIDQAEKEINCKLKCKITIGAEREGWSDYNKIVNDFSDRFETPVRELRNNNDDIMLIYFTSGTASFPKMVAHNFTYPLAHIITAKYWQNVQDGGLHYTVADTGWAKAVWGKIYGQWLAGSRVFVYDYDKFEAENMLRAIINNKVTSFCAPPTIYRFLIRKDLSDYDLSCLESAVVAGEPLNPEVYNRFKEKTGLSLKEAYGQTELVTTTANWPWLDSQPGSMGMPSPGYEIKLLDSDGREVETGEEAELCIKTDEKLPPGIFIGYHRDKEMTDDTWRDGYYHTGDVAWKDAEGRLWFVGRADDVIKSSGYRIGPFEVESVLMQHPAVTECAITGAPDVVRGQIVKATIVLSSGHEANDNLKVELQNFVKENTAPYKYPRIIEFVKEMPKTISGKIRRVALRDDDK